MTARLTASALLLAGFASAQTSPTTPTAPAVPQTLQQRISGLSPRLGQQVNDVYNKTYAALISHSTVTLRQNCARWQTDLKAFDLLSGPEVTAFLTPVNWAENPRLFDWIVNLRHLQGDLNVALGTLCAATVPTQAELLGAYAVISNAYGMNRQMSLQLLQR